MPLWVGKQGSAGRHRPRQATVGAEMTAATKQPVAQSLLRALANDSALAVAGRPEREMYYRLSCTWAPEGRPVSAGISTETMAVNNASKRNRMARTRARLILPHRLEPTCGHRQAHLLQSCSSPL